mgnify:CR=1 FL=1
MNSMLTKTKNKLSIQSNWDKNLNYASGANLFGIEAQTTDPLPQTDPQQCPSDKSQCCQSAVNTC